MTTTFNFGFGAGDVLIDNLSLGSDRVDTVLCATDLPPSQITLIRGLSGEDSLTLTINGTTDRLTILNYFQLDGTTAASVDNIVFADSTIWSVASIKSLVLIPTTGNDILYGYATDDLIQGGAGNDTLYGKAGNDRLEGGTGADTLVGGTGNDTLVVDNAGDVLAENATEGTDTVESSVNWTLGNNLENLTLIGGALNGTGNTLANVITGNAADNLLDGGIGADTMTGGLGNDSYIVDSLTDVVVESTGGGTDTVFSNLNNVTLASNVENLTLTGTALLTANGNSLDNVITSNSSHNYLRGGMGNDTYVLTTTALVTEYAGGGIDTVMTSADYYMDNEVENLIQTGSASIYGTGNALSNYMKGNVGNNELSGGAGNDTMEGGLGNDSYSVDSSGDIVIEQAGGGIDKVSTSVNYILGAEQENLVLVGNSGISGTGNELDNVFSSNMYINTIAGKGGNDTYIVTEADVLIENANEGTDTVQSSLSWTLGANFENLLLTNTGAINGTGNTLANRLTGNSSNNILDGGVGDDVMEGGLGNDIYYVDSAGDTVLEQAGAGTDTVYSALSSYTLTAEVESLILTGSADINGTGNAFNNTLTGNAGLNVLTGGQGDDVYYVSAGDTVVEAANEGVDTLYAGANWTLGDNQENLTLTGIVYLGIGNALANRITGNAAANSLNGGTGDDVMDGGLGNDVYYVDSTGDTVIESSTEVGSDQVFSLVSWTLGTNVENLRLVGIAAINGTGNSQANTLSGNSASNILSGGAGNDLYEVSTGDTVIENAGQGTDIVYSDVSWTLSANVEQLVLTGNANIDGTGNLLDNTFNGNNGLNVFSGGLGNDLYFVGNGDTVVENAGEGIDTVSSNQSWTLGANQEILQLSSTAALTGVGNSLDNTLSGAVGGTCTLIGGLGNDSYAVSNGATVIENANEGVDTILSSINWTLGANLENLTLTGSAITGIGNALDNTLTGNSFANTLTGGQGNDTYVVGSGDIVIENANEGVDTVLCSVDWTLGANIENLTLNGVSMMTGTGNALDNVLTGINVGQTLRGLLGNDSYVVSAACVVTENAGEGTDTVLSSVAWTLGANLENLTLTGTSAINGTGNTLANYLLGNGSSNILDGGVGNDVMEGGLGNDIYLVDSSSDVVIEQTGSGVDEARTSASFILGSNVESLTLTGTAAITGTGNELDNTLSAGSSNQTLVGGLGNDTYIVSTTTTLMENAGEGTDTVSSSITWTLGTNLENLMLTGTSAINGIGNALANTLTGNGGNNVLDGSTGDDMLIGGLGNDTYFVDSIGDMVIEQSSAGTDSISSAISWALGSNIENLILTGSASIDGTGNSLDNTLTGNSGVNMLSGGLGNDSYYLGSGDTALENAGEGTDTVYAGQDWTLGANLENLTLTGSAITGIGNAQDNRLVGNALGNVLDGGAGNDVLDGGLGSDIYYVDSTGDQVTESSAETSTDVVYSLVSWTLANNLENLTLTGSAAINGSGNSSANILIGNSASNTLAGSYGNDIYVVGFGDTVVEAAGAGTDTVQSDLSWMLSANVENLVLTGSANIDGAGNTLDNTLTGNSGLNMLSGGLGNDSYYVGSGDTVMENIGEGTDTVYSGMDWTLSANVENLTLTGSSILTGTGNDLGNTLTGNSGASILAGGQGNDTYQVTASTLVVENANEGIDTVISGLSWTLAANVENLTLTGSAVSGTGNTLDNILTGNTVANTLAGGQGNDTYLVDFTDTVVENAGEGVDTVVTSANWTLGVNVENLTLTGVGSITGIGNALDNSLTSNVYNQTLRGGLGNDNYIVSTTTTLVENAGEGTDTVLSAISWTLGSNFESLVLTGTGATTGYGNTQANTLKGNIGNNTLQGGAGNDTYLFDAGWATDTVTENDATTGNTDIARFGSGINYDQLWFVRNGTKLEVSRIGTADKLVITNWYGGSANHLEQLISGDGKTLTDAQVDNLVNAMASLTPPPFGQTTLSPEYQNTLGATLAANWQ